MTLKFNPKTNEFVIISNDEERAEAVGLTLSTRVRGPAGEKVWFTPSPYAALPYFKEADAGARQKLGPMWADYSASWATETTADFPRPAGKAFKLFQRAGIEYAMKRPHALIGDQPGLGKQNPVTTPILTPTGWVPMGTLKVGDLVGTVDGTFTKVTGVFPQGIQRVYEIHFRDGTKAECGKEHLWSVSSPLRRKRARKSERSMWITKTTADLIEGGLRLPDIGDNRVRAKWFIPLVEPVQHPYQDLPIDPYVLGILIGDGCLVNGATSFSNPDFDSDIRENVRKRLPVGFGITEDRSPNCPRFFIVCGKNAHSIKWAISDMGLDVHSAEKFIPHSYQFASVAQRWDLLRGLMDTDGSCKSNRATFHTTSLKLADGVAQLVRSLGGVAIVRGYDRSAEEKPYEYQVNIKTFECPFLTSRKSVQWKAPNRYAPIKYIQDIVDTGRDIEQVCISVAHPSHLYVMNDYVVTHNTVQAIGIANQMQAEHILIVCPASVRLHWQRFVRDWSIVPRVTTYPILRSSSGVNPFANYVIISYDLIRNEELHEALCMVNWDLIVCDEAHYLKSIDVKRTRAIFGGGRGVFKNRILAEKAKRIVGLTGTPLPNRPRESYTLARALCWESIDWLTYDDFCYRFNPSGRMDSGWVEEKKGRLPELQSRLRCNFMVRRHKKDVLKELPDKQFDLTYVEPNGAIRDVLSREALIGFNVGDLKNPHLEFGGEVSTVRREMGEAMIPSVVEHIRYLLDVVELPKLVIFSHHKSVMDYLWASLENYGIVEIRGGTGIRARDLIVQQFQADPNIRVFSGQMQASGEGIDGLQNVCTHAVFTEPSWVPKDNEQCADRLHRMGQHGNVIIQLMVVEGSIAERILATTIDKAHTIHESLDNRHAS